MKAIMAVMCVFSAVTASMVYSHSGATGIVKERMDAMEAMGDESKRIADMFKGKSEFDKSALSEAAHAFELHGAKIAELFPDTVESRTGSETRAQPRIWEEWDEFNDLVNEFVVHSESLKKTVATSDDIGQLKKAFKKTTRNCSVCHKRFRRPRH